MLGAAAAAAMLPSGAGAAVINPTTYSTINGGIGSFNYADDAYTGTNIGGFLSGGLGELTDGIVATARWNSTPGPYVGWRFISPEITFSFEPLDDLAKVTFFFDDAQGAGGVFLPGSLSFDFGSGYVLGTPTITSQGNLGVYTYDFTNISADSFKVRIDSDQEWVMLTEVDFEGTLTPAIAPIPEPASWAMMLGGFGLVGAVMRRRAGVMVRV
jgi:hypothetical protein